MKHILKTYYGSVEVQGPLSFKIVTNEGFKYDKETNKVVPCCPNREEIVIIESNGKKWSTGLCFEWGTDEGGRIISLVEDLLIRADRRCVETIDLLPLYFNSNSFSNRGCPGPLGLPEEKIKVWACDLSLCPESYREECHKRLWKDGYVIEIIPPGKIGEK